MTKLMPLCLSFTVWSILFHRRRSAKPPPRQPLCRPLPHGTEPLRRASDGDTDPKAGRRQVVKRSKLAVMTILLVFGATAALFASGGIFPKPISSELPMYPERARSARVAGTVKIWFAL